MLWWNVFCPYKSCDFFLPARRIQICPEKKNVDGSYTSHVWHLNTANKSFMNTPAEWIHHIYEWQPRMEVLLVQTKHISSTGHGNTAPYPDTTSSCITFSSFPPLFSAFQRHSNYPSCLFCWIKIQNTYVLHAAGRQIAFFLLVLRFLFAVEQMHFTKKTHHFLWVLCSALMTGLFLSAWDPVGHN